MSLDPIQQAAQEQFQRRSHRYGKGHILEDTRDVTAALEGLSIPPGAEALDIATGAGHTAFCLAAAGFNVTASDITPAMLDRVQEGAAERGLHIRTCQHSAEALPYPDATFDLVTCRVAPHHFSSPADFIRESARVLKPGRWFLLIDLSIPDDSPEAGTWLNAIEKLHDPSHNRLLSPREWRSLCEQSGLTIRSLQIVPRKQPDIEWWFNTSATPEENREKGRAMVATAPQSVRDHYHLAIEDGKTVWSWPMVSLVAQKPE